MALGSTLGKLISLVKNEVKGSLSVGTSTDDNIRLAVELAQEWLATEHDWSELKDQWPSSPSSRWTAFPTTDLAAASYSINFDRPVCFKQKFNSLWQEVDFGISTAEYDVRDSDDSETQDPIQRWDYKQGDRSYFEVWPIPTAAVTARFFGQRKPKTLRSGGVLNSSCDTLVLDLDDQLVALVVAVDMLGEKPAAAPKATRLKERFAAVRGNNLTRDQDFVLGGNVRKREIRRVPMIIVP